MWPDAPASASPRTAHGVRSRLFLRGTSLHLTGDRVAAVQVLDEGADLGETTAPAVTSLCLAQAAMIAIERRDWDTAAELTDRARNLIEEHGLAGYPMCALAFAASAATRAHHGRADEAKHDLRTGIELLAVLGDFIPWYGAEARILLAHASLWLADVVCARTLLAEASRLARRTSGAVIFQRWFDDAWSYMDALAETSLAGPSSLTIAELQDPAVPAEPSIVPRDRGATRRFGEHGEDAGARRLPQARSGLPVRGRDARLGRRPSRSVGIDLRTGSLARTRARARAAARSRRAARSRATDPVAISTAASASSSAPLVEASSTAQRSDSVQAPTTISAARRTSTRVRRSSAGSVELVVELKLWRGSHRAAQRALIVCR